MLSCVMALIFGAADAEGKSNEEVTAMLSPPSERYYFQFPALSTWRLCVFQNDH